MSLTVLIYNSPKFYSWEKLCKTPGDVDCHTESVLTHNPSCAGVLLLKAVQQWYTDHDGRLPANARDKADFRSMLKSWQRSTDGIPRDVRDLPSLTSGRCYTTKTKLLAIATCVWSQL